MAYTSPPPNDQKTSAEGGSYNVSMMTYPADLDGMSETMNYVQFWINVQEEAKISKNNNLISGTSPNTALMNSIVGKAISKINVAEKTGIVGAATGLVGGAAAGAAGSAAKNGAGEVVANLKGTIGGAIKTSVGAGLAAAGSAGVQLGLLEYAKVDFGKATKRLKTAITLYTPQQLSVRYGTQWGEEAVDMGMSLAAATGNSSIDAESKPLRSAAGAFVLGQNGGYSAAAKAAANPRKEQVFKGVDYRRFTFEYQFAPRDENEANAALNIIYLFKYHMHPEFKSGSANFIYVYPSEFDIEYYTGADPNTALHKHSSCVLTEMNVNYSPNGVFNTFPDGSPTIINLTLNFVELEALTKERILQGL